MKIAGGIIAIIAGLLGIVAAVFTLFVGGVGSAFESEGAGTIIGLGWGGILFSLLVIVFGAVAIAAKSRKPAIALMVCAVLGAILGGTFVAICMALALVGGIIAAVPKPRIPALAPEIPAVYLNNDTTSPVPAPSRSPKKALIWTGAIAGILLLLIIVAAIGSGSGSSPASSAATGEPIENREEGPLTAELGTPVTTGKFEITVTSVELRDRVGGEFLNSSPSEGGTYVAVQWRYKNISPKPVGSFSLPRLKLADSNGTEYDPDISASSYYAGEVGADTKILSDLNPGITSTDVKVFEVSRESLSTLGWQLRIKADQEIVVPLGKREESVSSEPESHVTEGTLTSIDQGDYVYLTVNERSGKEHTFVLGSFPGYEAIMENQSAFTGKQVRVTWAMVTDYVREAGENMTRPIAHNVHIIQ